MPKSRAPIVALVLTEFSPQASALTAGVRRYADQEAGWRLVIHHTGHGQVAQDLARSTAAGFIMPPRFSSRLPGLNLAGRSVVLTDDPELPEMQARFPYVAPDNVRIGMLAAEHLLERHFPHFAFYGRGASWSRERERGFVQRIESAGGTCITVGKHDQPNSFPDWSTLTARRWLRGWLRRLPRPVAICVCQDHLASLVYETAEELGWQITRDWILIGVDNVGFLCGSRNVSLTSVALDHEALGYGAARLLASVMSRTPVQSPVIVPPGPLVARESTDAPLFNDADLHQAMRIMRDQAGQGLRIDEVADRVSLSRSTVERRYKRATGVTLGSSIRKTRLERVCDLLKTTNLPLWRIAEDCGYSGSPALSRAFSRAFGCSPSDWRTRSGGREGGIIKQE